MLKLIYTILLTVLISYIVVGILLTIFQRKLIYFPTEKSKHSFNQKIFDSDGQKIIVVRMNNEINNISDSAILYFGGNAESVVDTAYDFHNKIIHQPIYFVNYRGYGGSSGTPEEQGLYIDALNIYDAISAKYKNISVIGRSLGSGVATYLASERSVEKLILVTPFDSIQNVAQKRFPYYPMSILLQDKFDSINRAKKIMAPTLILSAENDEVVKTKHTEALKIAFKHSLIKNIVIPNSGHNTLSINKQYHESINTFLE